MTLRPRIIGRIAFEEWRLMLRNRVALAAGALTAILLVTASWVSHEQREALAATRAHYQALVDKQFDAQPDRHPHRMVHYGHFVFRPLPALAFFDPGVDAFTGNMLFVEGHRQNSAMFAEARQSSLLLRFGQLTPAFVLQTLVPLLLVFLGFASVARERERGNLRLMLAQGVAPGALLIGKWLSLAGIAAVVAFPASLALAVSVVAGTASAAAAAALIAVYGLYLAVWVSLTVLVSAWAGSGRNALLILIGFWIASTMMLPRTAPAIAQAEHPLPTRIEMDIAVHRDALAIGDSHDPADPYYADFKRKTLERYGVSRVEDLPVNYAGLLSAEGERLTSGIHDRHAARGFGIERAQSARAADFGWVSPVMSVRQASMALAGTDLAAYQGFLVEAERYRYGLIQALNAMHAEKVRFDGDKNHRISHAHWKTLPEFRPVPSTGGDPANAGRAVAVLAVWTVLLAGLLTWRGHRWGGL
jgi:ABC-2 type transport system permease protein